MSWNDPMSPCIAILFIYVIYYLTIYYLQFIVSFIYFKNKLRFHLVVKRSLILIFYFQIFNST